MPLNTPFAKWVYTLIGILAFNNLVTNSSCDNCLCYTYYTAT